MRLYFFFGDYEAVYEAISSRLGEVLECGEFDLLVSAGTVAAALGKSAALELFEIATTRAASPSAAYGAQHRLAAFEIKRLKRSDLAMHRLECAKEQYINSRDHDRVVNLALLHNLMALAVAEQSEEQAIRHMELAIENLRKGSLDGHFDNDLNSRLKRYESQIAINVAQLHVNRGQAEKGWLVLKENLESMKERSYDYIPEALAELAYLSYLAGKFSVAVELGSDAFWRYYSIGALSGMRNSRYVISASLLELGEREHAERIGELADNDILGCGGLHSAVL
ncbi:hypothetical protein [Trueperella pyogenes]|uniref:hypothetical protein n=1 Tax=Trueperella pyogenes TaxID=1661 RepID=UPI00345DD776